METRRLGSAGPEITTIGCGCWAMGGLGREGGWAGSWGAQDDRCECRTSSGSWALLMCPKWRYPGAPEAVVSEGGQDRHVNQAILSDGRRSAG